MVGEGEIALRLPVILIAFLAAGAATAAAQQKPPLDYPLIQGHGGIVRLPNAVQKPRQGSSVVLDVTRGARADGVLVALDRVARYVNLYADAGMGFEQGLRVAVVMHGGATPSALSDAAYKSHFGTPNPDGALIRQLAAAGVEIFVCGQSLMHAGYRPEETSSEVSVAVAAATALIELQRDGYSYMPLQ
jgi:intracellular sulfur oxidation DsrE/DsrF family protein